MLVLEDEFPNFSVNTTEGSMNLYDYIGNSWAVLFCQNNAFTPICTSDLARVVQLMPEFHKRNVKCIGMTCSPNEANLEWTKDILSYTSQHNNLGIRRITDEGSISSGLHNVSGVTGKHVTGSGCLSGFREPSEHSMSGMRGQSGVRDYMSGTYGDLSDELRRHGKSEYGVHGLHDVYGKSRVSGVSGREEEYGGVGSVYGIRDYSRYRDVPSGSSQVSGQRGFRGDVSGTTGDQWSYHVLRHGRFPFPIISDVDLKMATRLGLVRSSERTRSDLQKTVRSCYIITPDKRVKSILWYPGETGRNYKEILRIIDSVQLSERNNNRIGTPAGWTQGENCLVIPVTRATEVETEPIKGAEILRVPSGRPYLKFIHVDSSMTPFQTFSSRFDQTSRIG